jgi:dGTPase
MITDLIETTMAGGYAAILISEPVAAHLSELRSWLHENVYRAEVVEDEFRKASRVLHELFVYFVEKPQEIVAYGGNRDVDDPDEIMIADFLAGMTDRYAMNLYQKLFFPQPWKAL